jgi:hypothetical protein
MPNKKSIALCLVLTLFLFSKKSLAQSDLLYERNSLGFSLGAHFAVGSHFQRLGLSINAYYISNHFQVNADTRIYFSAKNLGPSFFYTEAVTAVGVVVGYGKKQTIYNPFLSSISNQTNYKYSVGYSYNAYWNKIKTTQQTGIIALQFDKVSIITENDLLARPAFDRFRTGAILVQYQHEDIMQVAINCSMWTGKMGFANRSDTNYPAVGYIDTIGSLYANHSHGLLSAQTKFNLGYGQSLQTNIGIDAERVRHTFQNKIIHDVCWLPKKWFKRNNCHIPMLDDKGRQYLYREGQKIKASSLYWNVFSNPSLFY